MAYYLWFACNSSPIWGCFRLFVLAQGFIKFCYLSEIGIGRLSPPLFIVLRVCDICINGLDLNRVSIYLSPSAFPTFFHRHRDAACMRALAVCGVSRPGLCEKPVVRRRQRRGRGGEENVCCVSRLPSLCKVTCQEACFERNVCN